MRVVGPKSSKYVHARVQLSRVDQTPRLVRIHVQDVNPLETKAMPNPAMKLINELTAEPLDRYTLRRVQKVKQAMTLLPMALVLDKLPGKTVTERAKRIGISRETWYGWYRGQHRPGRKQAKRLQQLTGIEAAKFQGRR